MTCDSRWVLQKLIHRIACLLSVHSGARVANDLVFWRTLTQARCDAEHTADGSQRVLTARLSVICAQLCSIRQCSTVLTSMGTSTHSGCQLCGAVVGWLDCSTQILRYSTTTAYLSNQATSKRTC